MLKRLPLACYGWFAKDSRVKSGLSIGNALLNGNYLTDWEHFDHPIRLALTSSFAYLKDGTEKLPKGTENNVTPDANFLLSYTNDVLKASKEMVQHKKNFPKCGNDLIPTIFERSYDFICPLPSSKGPTSATNMKMASCVSQALSNSGKELPIAQMIQRFKPMPVKSTKTDKEIRKDKDAPRLMHYDSMKLNLEYQNEIKGSRILLYDDVFTWGNTSEAARNLLILAGASEVDVFTIFNKEEFYKFTQYFFKLDQELLFQLDSIKKENFELNNSEFIEKRVLKWKNQQEGLKEWQELTLAYIESCFAYYVPNEIHF